MIKFDDFFYLTTGDLQQSNVYGNKRDSRGDNFSSKIFQKPRMKIDVFQYLSSIN